MKEVVQADQPRTKQDLVSFWGHIFPAVTLYMRERIASFGSINELRSPFKKMMLLSEWTFND